MAGKGCCSTTPTAKSFLPLSVCFFWDFGPPPAGIWPGTSLSVIAPVAGQARVGLFEYCPGSVPSAAGAAGRGWLC